MSSAEARAAAGSIVLHQFRASHYNEKVRWALDWKRVPHRRVDHLPGPHRFAIRRLSGQTLTPVVVFGETVVAGSNHIVLELERRHPEPPLVSEDPTLRARSAEWVDHFDRVVGPLVRRSLFAVLIEERSFLCALFASGRPKLQRLGYRLALPLVRPLMKRSMGIAGPESIAEAERLTAEALASVHDASRPTGYLVGDRFGIADLTAAALLAPAADPEGSPLSRHIPRPEAVRGWIESWASKPGAEWVREIYRRHRSPEPLGSGRDAA